MRVFTEVPDVAILVLSEPIERILRQFFVEENAVVDLYACDAPDHPRIVAHGELGVIKTLRGLTLVDEGCARLQREEGIVDLGASIEVRRIDHGVVGGWA